VVIVTGLRALVGAAPSGECELHLVCPTEGKAGDRTGDDEYIRGCCAMFLWVVRRVFTRARDMATTRLCDESCWMRRNLASLVRTIRRRNETPSLMRQEFLIRKIRS